MKVKTFTDSPFKLLMPAPDKCQECATKHDPAEPHNKDSLFYQFKFNVENKRSATWKDAMAHCTEDVKNKWVTALKEHGIIV